MEPMMHSSMSAELPIFDLSLKDKNKSKSTCATAAFHRSVPDHLIALHQPRDHSEGTDEDDDAQSLGSTDLFDPPLPPKSRTPLLDAAIKAKEQVKQGTAAPPSSTHKNRTKNPSSTTEDFDRSVPDFLLTLNQPSEKHSIDPSSHDEDDDNVSLGAPELFDPVSPPPPKKPLLHAAIKAKEQQERMKGAVQQAPFAAM